MTMWKILIIFVGIVCILCADYILQIRKVYKIHHEEIDKKILKLHETKERGERLLNVLGVMYVPTVLGMLEGDMIVLNVKIIIFLAVTAIIIALNCRLYKYAIYIKKLEIHLQK